jgi:hypothetical protein
VGGSLVGQEWSRGRHCFLLPGDVCAWASTVWPAIHYPAAVLSVRSVQGNHVFYPPSAAAEW